MSQSTSTPNNHFSHHLEISRQYSSLHGVPADHYQTNNDDVLANKKKLANRQNLVLALSLFSVALGMM